MAEVRECNIGFKNVNVFLNQKSIKQHKLFKSILQLQKYQ